MKKRRRGREGRNGGPGVPQDKLVRTPMAVWDGNKQTGNARVEA